MAEEVPAYWDKAAVDQKLIVESSVLPCPATVERVAAVLAGMQSRVVRKVWSIEAFGGRKGAGEQQSWCHVTLYDKLKTLW